MTLRRLIFAKIYFLKYKLWHILHGFILPGDDTLAIFSGLISMIASITHTDCAYGGKKRCQCRTSEIRNQ